MPSSGDTIGADHKIPGYLGAPSRLPATLNDDNGLEKV